MADVYEIIANAASKHGVPVEALLAIGNIESGFNSAAKNPRSSASGAFQFTDGTAREYGLTGDKRNDLAAQADAAARMASKNSKALTATLGRAPSAGEIYLAHQQGLSGAKALLSNPSLPASQVLSRYHGDRAASVIRQNGGNPDMTAGEFANQWVSKGDRTAGLFPPGEIPSVATALSTSRTPPPIPPRRPDTAISALRKPTSAGDGLALNPVARGQTAPMFDGEYSALNQGMMRMPAPEATWGMNQERTPYPALPSPQMAGLRATRPDTQVAANQAAEQMRSRSTAPQRMASVSASDRSRGASPMTSLTIGGRAPVGLVEPGNLDLNKRTVFNDGSGGYRTENSMSIGTDRGEALIPTVVGGRQLSEKAAIDHYLSTGENLGYFKTPEASDRYAQTLHERQAVKYAPSSNIGQPPVTRSVPSVPVPVQTAQARLPELSAPFSGVALPRSRPDVSPQTAARGTSSVLDNYAYNTRPPAPMSVEQMYAGIYPSEPGQFRVGSTDGLGAGSLNGSVAAAALTGGVNERGLPVTAPFQVASLPPLPMPLDPRSAVGGRAVAPTPFARPSFLSLPSMPYARPSQRTAPMPMPASMRPQSRAPIFLQPAQRRAPVPMPTPQQQRAAAVNNGNNGGSSQNSQPSVVNGHTASGGVRYDPDSAGWVRA